MDKPISTSSYLQKVLYAIETLSERGGSSYQKIESFLRNNYPTMDVKHNFVMKALRKGVDEDLISQDGHSYKLSKKTKATVKKEGKIIIKKTNKTTTPTKKEKKKDQEAHILITVMDKHANFKSTVYLVPHTAITEELHELLRNASDFDDIISSLGVDNKSDDKEEKGEDVDRKNEERWEKNRKFFKQYKLSKDERMDINMVISRVYTFLDRN